MTPDRAERAVDAAFGPGAWAEAGEHMTPEEHIAELEAAIDRVRRLHSQPQEFLAPGKWCPGCGWVEPCPTIRALNGTSDPDSHEGLGMDR